MAPPHPGDATPIFFCFLKEAIAGDRLIYPTHPGVPHPNPLSRPSLGSARSDFAFFFSRLTIPNTHAHMNIRTPLVDVRAVTATSQAWETHTVPLPQNTHLLLAASSLFSKQRPRREDARAGSTPSFVITPSALRSAVPCLSPLFPAAKGSGHLITEGFLALTQRLLSEVGPCYCHRGGVTYDTRTAQSLVCKARA